MNTSPLERKNRPDTIENEPATKKRRTEEVKPAEPSSPDLQSPVSDKGDHQNEQESPSKEVTSENEESTFGKENTQPLTKDQLQAIEKRRQAALALREKGRLLKLEKTTMEAGWFDTFKSEMEKEYFLRIKRYLEKEKGTGQTVYPAEEEIYTFTRCPIDKIRVVILGQDPYHGPGQAMGLCFGVKKGVTPPPSLINIFKELEKDLGPNNFKRPGHGCLQGWCDQGVLLLNASLTVRRGAPASHSKIGWTTFTDAIVTYINRNCRNVVFMLWGAHAQKKGASIDMSGSHSKSVRPADKQSRRKDEDAWLQQELASLDKDVGVKSKQRPDGPAVQKTDHGGPKPGPQGSEKRPAQAYDSNSKQPGKSQPPEATRQPAQGQKQPHEASDRQKQQQQRPPINPDQVRVVDQRNPRTNEGNAASGATQHRQNGQSPHPQTERGGQPREREKNPAQNTTNVHPPRHPNEPDSARRQQLPPPAARQVPPVQPAPQRGALVNQPQAKVPSESSIPDLSGEAQGDPYDQYDDDFEDYEEDFETFEEDDDKENWGTVQETATKSEPQEKPKGQGDNKAAPQEDESFVLQRPMMNLEASRQKVLQEKRMNEQMKRQMQRYKDLKNLIDLDVLSYEIFDLPPLNEYELFIRNYGKSNTVQSYTQCNEDRLEKEIQTEPAEVEQKWSQAPPEDLFKDVGEGWTPRSQSAKGVSKKQQQSEFNMRRKLLSTEKSLQSVRLTRFLARASKVLDVLLDENSGEIVLTNLKGSRSQFSHGYFKLGIPDVLRDSVRQMVSASWLGLGPASAGSVALQRPSYSTDGLYTKNRAHEAAIVRISPINELYGDDASFSTSPLSSSSDISAERSFELVSVDQSGSVQFWAVLDLKNEDAVAAEFDYGMAIGSKVRLVHTKGVSLSNPDRFSHVKEVTATDARVVMGQRLLIGTHNGYVLQESRFGDRVFPRFFHTGKSKDSANPVKSLAVSATGGNFFLAGFMDGSVALFSLKKDLPLSTWDVPTTTASIDFVAWSVKRPAVFFAVDSRSMVYVWDLLKSDKAPIFSTVIQSDPPVAGARITSVEVVVSNQKRGISGATNKSSSQGLLIVAFADGSIHVQVLEDSLAEGPLEGEERSRANIEASSHEQQPRNIPALSSPIPPAKRLKMSAMDEDEDYINDFEDDDFVDDDEEEEEEEEEEMDAEDANFAPVIADKDLKKPYEVDYIVHSIQDIVAFQSKEVDHVAGILGCRRENAATLLRSFKWNKERLVERYMEQPEQVCEEAGVILDAAKQPKFTVIKGFVCDICCNDEDGLETLALSCGHRFCRDCYEQYLTQKIAEEGESRRIQCMGNCRVSVDEKTVQMVVKPNVYQKYQSLLLRTYVDDNTHLKWCPAPNCEYAVECPVSQTQLYEVVPTVKCNCGHKFCFGCGLADHQPCVCALVKLWMKKCEDDSETANWISANTKECTKCMATIEKNGGCNHMTCRKCKYEFCWVCMGPWSEHGTQWYNCNRFDEKASVDARDQQAKSRAALERYLHYYNRYANHEQSAKLDKELYEKTEKKMEEMQQSSELSWIEVQFLRKAVEVLLQSRSTLKWTYCFAYYLARNNTTMLFEDNQRDLEMAVEQLSELLEKPIEPAKIGELKQAVLDKSVYVSSRLEVVLEDTAKGLSDGRWKYNMDLPGLPASS
ncbi:hypothetical protein HK102_000821 [Quaeritorhiza haematococci]|nr:hypothetical protein HK102_000821 [Quaeritorhiza haematococci]